MDEPAGGKGHPRRKDRTLKRCLGPRSGASSTAFSRAPPSRQRPALRAFLAYVVGETLAGRGDRIKAVTIGEEARLGVVCVDPDCPLRTQNATQQDELTWPLLIRGTDRAADTIRRACSALGNNRTGLNSAWELAGPCPGPR